MKRAELIEVLYKAVNRCLACEQCGNRQYTQDAEDAYNDYKRRSRGTKLDALMAMIRDICRHSYGDFHVPDWYVERAVLEFKGMKINGALIWPHEEDPVIDPWTGEILYRPISRAKLSSAQETGICNWLSQYMIDRNIPSNHPQATE